MVWEEKKKERKERKKVKRVEAQKAKKGIGFPNTLTTGRNADDPNKYLYLGFN